MGRERADAWRELPPFDRLFTEFVDRSEHAVVPAPCPDDVPIYMTVRGTHVSLRVGTGRDATKCQFRYRRSRQAWEMFVHDGVRWVADVPTGVSAGEFLEKILHVLLGGEADVAQTH